MFFFKNPSAAEVSESVYMRERVNYNDYQFDRVEKIVAKGEIAHSPFCHNVF